MIVALLLQSTALTIVHTASCVSTNGLELILKTLYHSADIQESIFGYPLFYIRHTKFVSFQFFFKANYKL